MKSKKNFLKNVVVIILAITTHSLSAQTPANNSSFNKLLDNYYEDNLILNPYLATIKGDNRYNDLMPNSISEPYLKKLHKYYIKYQKKLNAYKRTQLNSVDAISYDIVNYQIKEALEKEKFHLEYLPFDQINGVPITLPSLGSGKSIQPFKTVKDYYNWIKRIDGFVDWVDTAIENFNKGIATGLVLPKALVVKMIPQMEAQTVTDTTKNIVTIQPSN